MIRSTLFIASLVGVAAAPTAHAQPAPAAKDADAERKPVEARKPAEATRKPSQKDIDAARKRFQAAEAAKARGDYQTAALEYLAAYELFQEPAFFFNTAEVYRLAGDDKNALLFYTKYLELDPTGKGAQASRIAADELRRTIAAREDAAQRKADAEAKRKADEDAKRAEQPAPPPPAVHSDDTARDRAPGRNLRIAGLASAGAGVVALGIGVVFGLKARSISNEAAEWTTFDPERDDEGKAAERNMFVLTGVGAAAIAAGGVLYYLGHRAETSSGAAIRVAPSIGPSQLALTAAGRF